MIRRLRTDGLNSLFVSLAVIGLCCVRSFLVPLVTQNWFCTYPGFSDAVISGKKIIELLSEDSFANSLPMPSSFSSRMAQQCKAEHTKMFKLIKAN